MNATDATTDVHMTMDEAEALNLDNAHFEALGGVDVCRTDATPWGQTPGTPFALTVWGSPAAVQYVRDQLAALRSEKS